MGIVSVILNQCRQYAAYVSLGTCLLIIFFIKKDIYFLVVKWLELPINIAYEYHIDVQLQALALLL